MIGTPLTFKGLLLKNSISEDTLKRYQFKIDELRKISESVMEYLLLGHRGIEMYNQCLIKQCQLLEGHINNDMNDDKRYYLQFSMIFQAISINFQHFNCTFESNLKEYRESTCMQFDEITTSYMDPLISNYKKYKTSEDALFDSSKKWLKQEKQLGENIKAYNESSIDPRLIYNKEETLKRYLYCEMSHNNIIKEENNIRQKINKSLQAKKLCIITNNKFIDQYIKSYQFVHERIILEAKNTLNLFCNVHKMVVSDIASKKKAFQETKIKPFLYFIPDISNERHFFNIPENFQSADNFPIFLQSPESIKDAHLKNYAKWLIQYGQFLKDSGQNSKKLLKRVYGFLLEITKTIQKMASYIIKQMPICYERLKKKMVQMFGSKTLDFIKSINAALQTSMRIYQKLIKVLYQKLESVNHHVNQDQKIGDMFFKQYNKYIEAFVNETKLLNVNDHKKQIKSAIVQKSEIVKHCLTSFGQKISKNNDGFRTEIKNILQEIFSSFNQIFIYSSQYLHTYFGIDFVDNLKKVWKDVSSIISSLEHIPDQVIKEEITVEEKQRFKYIEFQKIKKSDNDLPKEGKENKQLTQAQPDNNVETIQRSQSLSSPIKKLSIQIDPKEKKNYDFISKKVNLQEGQQFKHTFKCALYDKILLQGKLYVTDRRLCFNSYFNTANLFFGGTFLQIPKKDIIKAEKRYNAKIFDNSVSITTINGQVFFTSFFSRDQAYNQIMSAFGLKVEEEVKEEQPKNQQQGKQQQPNLPQNHKSIVQQQQQDPIIQTQPDDITPQQLKIRAEKLQQVINNKMQKLSTFVIHHANCIYLLKQYFNNREFTNAGKNYSKFYQYLKFCMEEKEIVVENWEPSIDEFLNKNNIKKDTPLRFNRKCKFNHTLPKSGIPFMPKFCKTQESHRMSIISADRFIVDLKINSTGAPYADTFIVYTRQDYSNINNGVQITTFLHIQFIKKSMVQGIIEKQTFKQMKSGIQNYVKFLNKMVASDPSISKKKLKPKKQVNKNSQDSSLSQIEELTDSKEQQVESAETPASQSLQDKFSSLLKQHESLKNKNKVYRNIIMGLLILLILSVIY